MLKSAIGRLRLIGMIEGVSFLVLLFIAVPLKRIAGIEDAVKIPGWIHGVLFMIYCVALVDTKLAVNWKFKRVAIALGAALVPFGPFLMDKSLRREDEALREKSD